MKFLIIGGHGFLGFKLVEGILQSLPTAEIHISTTRKKLAGGNIVYVDYASFESVSTLLRKITPDYIIHLASYTLRDPSKLALIKAQVRDDNILNALAVLENIPKLIFISSMAVFSVDDKNISPNKYQPVSEYGFEKLYMINRLSNPRTHQKMIDYKVVYPSSIYGKGQTGKMFLPTLLSHIKKQKVMIAFGGHKRRDFIHVSDVSKALLKLIINYDHISEKHVFIRSHDVYKLREITDMVCDICKLDPKKVILFKDTEQNIQKDINDFQNITSGCFKLKLDYQVPIRDGLKDMFAEF